MTMSEYFSFNIELTGLANSAFELWLGTTFAFIVAIFFAGESLTRSFYRILVVLYSLSVTVFVFNYVTVSLVRGQTSLRMSEQGIEFPTAFEGASIITLFGMIIIMIGDTIGALLFARKRMDRGDK
ncbi:MAG: hypothetical protein RLP02_20905 [Coleofasciculus sp. C2-GNP5-27]